MSESQQHFRVVLECSTHRGIRVLERRDEICRADFQTRISGKKSLRSPASTGSNVLASTRRSLEDN